MTAARVHAVLAAAVDNPALIARWKENPKLVSLYGIGPESIDLETLSKFAGLTVKVRHNGVRQIVPVTFRLMSLLGLEIEIFASYASFIAKKKRQYAATAEERLSELIGFLEDSLDHRRRNHILIWDLIRHEQAVAQLTNMIAKPSRVGGGEHGITPKCEHSVPTVCGYTVLRSMRCDARTLALLVSQSVPELSELRLERRYFCYWLAPSVGEIQMLDLDDFGFYLLSLIDGKRSTTELNRQLGGDRRSFQFLLNYLSNLAEIGIIQI